MTPAKIYPFSIPAGGSFPLLVIGDYCKILTSSGPLELAGDTFGSIGPILAGQGVQDSPFNRLVLVDRSGATNNGTILIADNAFIDDRITGSVSVIDSNRDLVAANQSFMGQATINAVPGQFTMIQLWNPSGSNKILEVDSIFVSSRAPTTNGQIYVQQSAQAPLANLIGNAGSLYFPGSLSTAELRFLNTAASASGFVSSPSTVVIVKDATASINTDYERNLKRPVIITPNNGLIAYLSTQQAGLTAQFSFVERAII